MRLHIGRKAPFGFREVGKSMHLGFGVWVMQIEKIERKSPKPEHYDPKQFRGKRHY